MGFGSTKSQLGMLILPRIRKHSDDTNSTTSSSDDDDQSFNLDPMPLMSMDRQNYGREGSSAYNFELFKEEVESIAKDHVMMRTPLPCFELVSTPVRSMPSPKASPVASYRWYMSEASNLCGKETNDDSGDVLKPLFTFASCGMDDDENKDYSASTSLLHGRTNKSLFPKLGAPSSSCFAPLASFRKKKPVDENTYLMQETAISNDWSERQLAFDLEVVEDDPSIDDTPLWMLHPPHFMLDPSLDVLPQQTLVSTTERAKPHLAVENKIQQAMYESLVRGGKKSTPKSHHKTTPTRHHHHNLHHQYHHNRRSSTGVSSRNRKSTRRRGSPTLRGGQFSPNLSTVPERPSEEDGSHILTPRNETSSNYSGSWSG